MLSSGKLYGIGDYHVDKRPANFEKPNISCFHSYSESRPKMAGMIIMRLSIKGVLSGRGMRRRGKR
jgi:hypothetical protein